MLKREKGNVTVEQDGLQTTCSTKVLNEEGQAEEHIEVEKKSWSSLFVNSLASPSMELDYVPADMVDGKPVVKLREEDVRKMETSWEHAIMLYAPDEGLEVQNIQHYARCVWPEVSLRKVVKHQEGYFLLVLRSEDDCRLVCSRGPYYMNRKPIVVKQWKLGFNFVAEVLKNYPVWVQLHNLPLSCWSKESLSRIGSAIGVPKFADDCTTRCKRINYARILVEVDVTSVLLSELNIEMPGVDAFIQKVKYEFLPQYC